MKLVYPLVAMFAVVLSTSAQSGGFVGPDNRPAVTVAAAADLEDDSGVRLVGFIVEAIGSGRYTFRDDTGTIVVAIDRDDWKGLEVTPETRIELVGEVDRDREILEGGRIFGTKVEIDVDSVKLAN